MFKQFIVALATLVAATAFAAVDANKASQAELESVKGIGPVLSTLILNERKKASFKDWNDLTTRVKGIGDASAGKFSANGLTVNGSAFSGAAPTAAKAAASGARSKPAKATAAMKPGASQ